MNKIKIIKKNDEYSSEYQIGDTFEIEGTWYGGVHIIGKTGIVCLNTNQYGYPRSTTCFYAFCQYRKK